MSPASLAGSQPALPARSRIRWLAAGAMVLTFAGCDAGPAYQRPSLDIPAAFRGTPATAAAAWPSADWWRGFNSAELNDLIDDAKGGSFDIVAAIARVRQADAQVRIAGAALLPVLNGTGNATWEHIGFGTGGNVGGGRFAGGTASEDLRDYSVGLNASYQLDFWGRNRALRQSSIDSAMFSRFDQQTVALTVLTNVANTWFTCLSLVDRLEIAHNNLKAAEDTLAVIRGRFEAGTANALDISQQESLVDALRANVPNLANQLEQARLSLGVLVGRPPEAISVTLGSLNALSLPLVSPGLPSSLLQRRPDIASAEAELAAQHLSIQAARAAFFPTLTLTGSAGYEAPGLNTLLSPAGALASLAAGLTAPLFDGGTLQGQLEQARGRYDELLADYRKAIVQAFTDVEQALAAWRFDSEQEALQRVAVETARRAATIAQAQMDAGTVDVTTVLTTEATLFSDEDILAQVRLARIQALLNLYKALGGGWQEADGPILQQFPGLQPGLLRGGVVPGGR
jgi:NodT family efflux transporter outer membrane factor (OMF) lipoprotein